jgi:hypothetical protein
MLSIDLNSKPDDRAKVSTRNLEKIVFHVNQYVSRQLIDTIESDVELVNRVGDELLFKLRAGVTGEKKEIKSIKYPKNWVEALKERFLPLCFKRRFKVKYTSIEVSFNVLYPTYRPASGGPVHYIQQIERF